MSNNLIHKIQKDVLKWKQEEYFCEISQVREILNFQKTENEEKYKFLRKAQFQAIETYLFLRFVKKTPKIIDLYKEYYSAPKDFCQALGINHIKEESFEFIDTIDTALQSVHKKENQEKYKYHSLIETLNLDYPSYILALAMGSGKTNIISSIIAMEFAIAMENEKNTEFQFMQNALVFAPGLTILKNSLKKISQLPFNKILPPKMCKDFLANVKYIHADNTKTLPLIKESKWNIVVLNTEKVILREEKARTDNQVKLIEERKLNTNARIEAIRSLPNLAIFSDEAHHTYGNKIDENLKKVRETINYIHQNKELVCVVNTTGTPYTGRQMIKDVIFWYGLENGIRDGILKSLENGIIQYSMENQEAVVYDIITDFFKKYTKGNEKIAFYFNSEDHLNDLRIFVEKALTINKIDISVILKHTQKNNNEKEFLSLDETENKKRIILLINKGKEGWDCKTLFATALITEASSSNNYILQASTRCLRQIDGNTQNATIYLSNHNAKILNNELEANYGITTTQLNQNKPNKFQTQELVVKKENPPKLEIKTIERKIILNESKPFVLHLQKPQIEDEKVVKSVHNLKDNQIKNTTDVTQISGDNNIGILNASHIIATKYHLQSLDVLKELQKIYIDGNIPESHLSELFKQIDETKKDYKEDIAIITKVLAIIKTEEGFQKSEDGKYYFHTIRFQEDKKPILKNNTENSRFGFHYEPYNFDSRPENDFFEKILNVVNAKPDEIEDIYFTGGITSPDKTDIHFEYKGVDGKYHKYYPDFLVRKKSGEVFIVEIKAGNKKHDPDVQAKEKAVQEISNINERKIKYCILYTETDTIPQNSQDYINIVNFIK
jgi:hypothetical protein